jgi:hypothetical protein
MHTLVPWKEEGSSGKFFSAMPAEEGETVYGFVLCVDDRYLAGYLESRKAFEKTYGPVTEADAKHLRFLLELADAVSQRNPRLLGKAVGRAFGDQPTFASMRVKSDPLMWLTGIFNAALSNCRPLVWWSNIARQMALGIVAKDTATALTLVTLDRIGNLGAIGNCKRCHDLFFRIKPSKLYCSDRCCSADAMGRWRKRKKRRSRKRS